MKKQILLYGKPLEIDKCHEYVITDLVNSGHIEEVKKNEYHQTRESYIRLNNALIRLNRRLSSPLWKLYYNVKEYLEYKIISTKKSNFKLSFLNIL